MALTFDLEVSAKSYRKLRKLRLWHWRQCLWNRELAQTQHAKGSGMSEHYNALANRHILAVQALNELFPHDGDTAERDAAIEDRTGIECDG